MIKAEVEYDDQHGPIVTVRTAEETVSVYLCAETGVVTTEKGQYGLEVSGPWFKVRAVLCPEGGAYRDYLLRENRLLREELAEARKPKTEREHAAVREIERLRHDIDRHIAIASEYATECERLRAELAACREDAERWRYLRDDGCGFEITVREENEDGYESWVAGYPAEELDAAIDAALAADGAG